MPQIIGGQVAQALLTAVVVPLGLLISLALVRGSRASRSSARSSRTKLSARSC